MAGMTTKEKLDELFDIIGKVGETDENKMAQWMAKVAADPSFYDIVKGAHSRLTPTGLRTFLDGLLTPGGAGPGPGSQADWVSQARSALYQAPSDFKMSTMQQAQRKAKGTLFHCYRPNYTGPPQQLPASLAHPAFGHFRDALANKERMPSKEAQDAALELATILSRGYTNEASRRLAVWQVLEPFFAPFSIQREKPLFEGSGYPCDGAIMPDDTTLLTLFEFKNEEYPSYFQGLAYYAQFVNNISDGASSNPALMVEICGPSLRISALFTAGPLSCGDIKAVVCEPLTPHQHFFMMPHDYQYMLTLARSLDALKACVMEIYRDKEQGARWEQPWDQPYPIPYSLCDGVKYTDVKHLESMRYLYTAVLHQPAEGPAELGGEVGSTSYLSAAAAFGKGGGDAAVAAVEQPASGSGSGRAVLVKYTTHVAYGEVVHRALAQRGLAPALHSCTHLPGRLVEVVMDYLDPSEGWTNLASLPTASQQQAQPAVTAAVQRMHAVVITDPATGKEGPVAHGDLRLTNIMLCKRQASETWTDAKVLFVDFDWACVDGAGVYPAFLNFALGRPSGVMAGRPIRQEHDIAFLEQSLRPPGSRRRPTTQRKAQAASTGLQGSRASRLRPPQPPAAAMCQPGVGDLAASCSPRRPLPSLRNCAPLLLRTSLCAVAQASRPRMAVASWRGA